MMTSHPGIVRLMNGEVDAAVKAVSQAESLLKSLQGVKDARINVDARGRFTRIVIVASDADERAVTRNVHSALMAALGVSIAPGVLQFATSLDDSALSINVVNLLPP